MRAMALLGKRYVMLCGPGSNGGDGDAPGVALRIAGRNMVMHVLGTPRGVWCAAPWCGDPA